MVECKEICTSDRVSLSSCSVTNNIYSSLDVGSLAGINHLGQPTDCAMAVTSATSSVVSTEGEGPCAECGEAIVDRFYLYALERRWHNSCLSCSVCRRHLESEGSCYVKDGLIYCKEDYFRRFGAQKCARCYNSIQSGEMVMRAQANVYHVKCFTCAICNCLLQTGDHFGIYDGKIYCRTDFEQLQYTVDSSSSQFSTNNSISSNLSPDSINMISSSCAGGPAAPQSICLNSLTSTANTSPINIPPNTNFDEINFGDYPPPLSHPDFPTHEQTQNTKPQRPRKRRQAETEQVWQMGLNMVDPESNFHNNGGQAHHVKQKRMRTSFKHHQLKVMKQYFNVNHNPDAKDLKQLSQKTGLSKRVLQVWFQNARAKFRRGQCDGSKDGNANEGEDNSNNEDGGNSNDEIISDAESQDMDSTNSIRSITDDAIPTSASPLNNLHQQETLQSLMTSSSAPVLVSNGPLISHNNHSEQIPGICI